MTVMMMKETFSRFSVLNPTFVYFKTSGMFPIPLIFIPHSLWEDHLVQCLSNQLLNKSHRHWPY